MISEVRREDNSVTLAIGMVLFVFLATLAVVWWVMT